MYTTVIFVLCHSLPSLPSPPPPPPPLSLRLRPRPPPSISQKKVALSCHFGFGAEGEKVLKNGSRVFPCRPPERRGGGCQSAGLEVAVTPPPGRRGRKKKERAEVKEGERESFLLISRGFTGARALLYGPWHLITASCLLPQADSRRQPPTELEESTKRPALSFFSLEQTRGTPAYNSGFPAGEPLSAAAAAARGNWAISQSFSLRAPPRRRRRQQRWLLSQRPPASPRWLRGIVFSLSSLPGRGCRAFLMA
jgi:hypothetical protein